MKRRGALTVEFALTAPIFFLVVFAGIEFARIHMIQNSMENAAFEGARRGIVPGATAEDCEMATKNLIEIIGLKDVQVTVSPNPITSSADSVTVEISIPIGASNGFGLTGFMSGKTMTKTAKMPIEWAD
jgi:Flp pilus assembly protein TadG